MPAPVCNTNASKWTLEKTKEILTQIEARSRLYGTDYLYEVLHHVGLHRNTWQYWYTKWADHEEIIERMMMVDQYFELRILKLVSGRQLNAGFGTMLLKTKYGYVEERWKYKKGKKEEE